MAADQTTLDFVIKYCCENLRPYGFSALYFFGSRACGNPRPSSDHDFIAVVSDTAPAEIGTGGALHAKIFDAFNLARAQAGLNGIDLLIARESFFQTESQKFGTFAHAAVTKGRKLV